MTAAAVTTWILDRLSTEWIGPLAVTKTVGGVEIPVTDWTYAVLPITDRPDETSDIGGVPTERDGGYGVDIGPDTDVGELAPGDYQIWGRYDGGDGQEKPVLRDFAFLRIL